MDNSECLKLKNQLCFPLYAASKEVIRVYKPILDEFDLTYTQYITMMVLWENPTMNVSELGAQLYLDSGTLTPVLKKLEKKGYITRQRSQEDERCLCVNLTDEGKALKEKALEVPQTVAGICSGLTDEDKQNLYTLLYKLLGVLGNTSAQ